jgi:excisionase family DNA binding protein
MARRISWTSPLLTVKDVCNHLKVKADTVYRLITAGKLSAFKVGGDYRFSREDIELRLSGPIAIPAMTGCTFSEERRRTQSETMKRRWADPEFRAKMTGKTRSPIASPTGPGEGGSTRR